MLQDIISKGQALLASPEGNTHLCNLVYLNGKVHWEMSLCTVVQQKNNSNDLLKLNGRAPGIVLESSFWRDLLYMAAWLQKSGGYKLHRLLYHEGTQLMIYASACATCLTFLMTRFTSPLGNQSWYT